MQRVCSVQHLVQEPDEHPAGSGLADQALPCIATIFRQGLAVRGAIVQVVVRVECSAPTGRCACVCTGLCARQHENDTCCMNLSL